MIPKYVLKQDGWVVKTSIMDHYVVSGTDRGCILVKDLVNCQNTWTISINGEITDICASYDYFIVGCLNNQLMISDWNGKDRKYHKIEGVWKIIEHESSFIIGTRNGILHLLDKQLLIRKSLAVDPVWELKAYANQIVVASSRGSIKLVDWSTGELIWQRQYNSPVYGVEIVGGLVYIGTADGLIEVLDSNSNPLNYMKTASVRSITRYFSGILVCYADGFIVSYDLDLKQKWAFKTKSWIKDVKARNKTVVIGSADHCIYILNDEGRLLGQYKTDYSVLSVDVNDETLVAGSADGCTYIFHI